MAEIVVTPENGLFGKEITVKIGDEIKIYLNGKNWRPGGKSYADTNMSPLVFKDPAILDLTTEPPRMEFTFLARATGRDETTFTSDDKSEAVMDVTIIVTK